MGACVGLVALLVFLPLLSTSLGVRPASSWPTSPTTPSSSPTSATWPAPARRPTCRRSSTGTAPCSSSCRRPTWPGSSCRCCRGCAGGRAGRAGSLTSLGVLGGAYLLATLGPRTSGLCWPVRLIEYLYLAAAVQFAVALSAGLATDQVRRRALASGAIVVLGATRLGRAARAVPRARGRGRGRRARGARGPRRAPPGHGGPGRGRRRGTRASSPCRPASSRPCPRGRRRTTPAYDLSDMAEGTAGYEGTVLQLAAISGVTTDQMRAGEPCSATCPGPRASRASVPTAASVPRVQRGLCIDYRGATCPEAFDRLWDPTGNGVPVPLVDALRVSTLVIQRSLAPRRRARPRQAGGCWTGRRCAPCGSGSSPSTATGGSPGSPGVEVLDDSRRRAGNRVPQRRSWPDAVRAAGLAGLHRHGRRPRGRGRGRPAGLVAVDLPAGSSTLELRHTTPGLRLGALTAAGAAAVAIVQSGVAVAETQVTGSGTQEVVAAA